MVQQTNKYQIVLVLLFFISGGGNRLPGENRPPVANHWQTLSHNVVWSTPRLSRIRNEINYKSNIDNLVYWLDKFWVRDTKLSNWNSPWIQFWAVVYNKFNTMHNLVYIAIHISLFRLIFIDDKYGYCSLY
jgi:hypothetical protein